MNLVVSGIHLKKFPKLEEYALEKAQKLSKYHSQIEETQVRLIWEKSHRGQETDCYCEITVHVPGRVLEIVDTERDMEKAIDRAIERMKRLIVKNKEKTLSKKHKEGLKNRNF